MKNIVENDSSDKKNNKQDKVKKAIESLITLGNYNK